MLRTLGLKRPQTSNTCETTAARRLSSSYLSRLLPSNAKQRDNEAAAAFASAALASPVLITRLATSSRRFFLLTTANQRFASSSNGIDNFGRMGVSIKFTPSNAGAVSDPAVAGVTVIGLVKNLQKVGFAHLRGKLEPRVDESVWRDAVAALNPSPTDTVSLYLNQARVAALPNKCSRHNTPSRGHAVTKIVKACSTGQSENVVVSCNAQQYAPIV